METNYQGFKDLNVYQNSYKFALRIFDLSLHFPKDERYSLTDQIRRSSRSVSANIAEAWSFRRYPKSFISKLNISYGEALETKVWLDFAKDNKYIDDQNHRSLYEEYDNIAKMLYTMMNQSQKFCH